MRLSCARLRRHCAADLLRTCDAIRRGQDRTRSRQTGFAGRAAFEPSPVVSAAPADERSSVALAASADECSLAALAASLDECSPVALAASPGECSSVALAASFDGCSPVAVAASAGECSSVGLTASPGECSPAASGSGDDGLPVVWAASDPDDRPLVGFARGRARAIGLVRGLVRGRDCRHGGTLRSLRRLSEHDWTVNHATRTTASVGRTRPASVESSASAATAAAQAAGGQAVVVDRCCVRRRRVAGGACGFVLRSRALGGTAPAG